MPKKHKKERRPRQPGVDSQIPISRVRPIKILGPRYYLQHVREYPILGCWIMSSWQKEGITPVVVARQPGPDRVIFAVCLVDLYCLGIKDAYTVVDCSHAKFLRELPQMCAGAPEQCSVELAHEIIYGSLEYAQRYGFQPHRDFTTQMCDQVLDPPETHLRKDHVKFGYKGKPLFVSGPNDDERRIESVINTLKSTAGEGNFHYMVGSGPVEFLDE